MGMIYHLPPGVIKANSTPPQARLATNREELVDNFVKIPQAVRTFTCATLHGHGKDQMLGRLDDVTRTFTVAGIAGLGSLGIHQTGASIPLWLGGASWLTAMAITPRLINTAVKLKTGVSLDTRYLSSNGEIRPLFQDPNFMPLQVLPQNTRRQLANNLNVPLNSPDSPQLLRAKLKQIVAQSHTWWMLMAGMATPVLAAVICDRLEDPAKGLASRLRTAWARRFYLEKGLQTHDGTKITQGLEKIFKATLGAGSDVTELSRWWKQLPQTLVHNLQLNRLSQSQLLHPAKEARFDAIASHMARHLGRIENQDTLLTTLAQQEVRLRQILSPLETLLQDPAIKNRVAKPVRVELEHQLTLARETAEATLQNFRQLVDKPLASMGEARATQTLKHQMSKSILAYIEQLNRLGRHREARALAGGPEQFAQVMRSMAQNKYATGFQQMGDSVKSFLTKATESLALRRRWLQRFPLLLGGLMVISSAIFIGCFLGRDFKAGPDGENDR